MIWTILQPSGRKARGEEEDLGEDREGKGMGKGEEEEFDEGKARMKLALVFAVIGVACLTGAPIGGAILGKSPFFPLSPFPLPVLHLFLPILST